MAQRGFETIEFLLLSLRRLLEPVLVTVGNVPKDRIVYDFVGFFAAGFVSNLVHYFL